MLWWGDEPTIVMHVSKKLEVSEPNRSGIEVMKRLVAEAETSRITIAIENTRRVGLIEALLDEIGSECPGLC